MSLSLNPPPRTVSLPVRAGLVFGTGKAPQACVFLLVTLTLVWFFAIRPLQSDQRFSGATETSTGTLDLIDEQLSPSHRGRTSLPVYAYHFSFQHQGHDFSDISYHSIKQQLKQGTEIPVEFLPGNPAQARINLPGYRTTVLDGQRNISFAPAWGFLLLPLVGLILWGVDVIRGLRQLKLIRHGKLTQARLVRKEDTGAEIIDKASGEKKHIHKLIFSFEVGGKFHELLMTTHQIEALTDDTHESALYLASNPSQALLIDSLPAWLHSGDGSFVAKQPGLQLAHLLTPLLLLGILAYIFLWPLF